MTKTTRIQGANHGPVLPFLVFWKKAGKTTKKTGIFYPDRTPKIPGEEGKNDKKNKEFLARRKNKEFQKNKERKDRGVPQTTGLETPDRRADTQTPTR